MKQLLNHTHLFLRIGLFLPVLFAFLFSLPGLKAQRSIPPKTEAEIEATVNQEREEAFKEARREWMDAMHRADPAVNTNVLNEETRRSKQLMHMNEKGGRTTLGSDNRVDFTAGLYGLWSERGSNNQAGRTLAADIDFQTGTIYVAADGGQIWRGTREGTNWTSLTDNRRFSGVRMVRVIRRDQKLRIIVVYGSHVAYSDNDGEDWNEATGLDDIQRWGGFSRAVIADGEEDVIYALGNEWNFETPSGEFAVLYRSTDLGTSFSKVRQFEQPVNKVDISAPPGENWTYLLHDDTLSQVNPDGSIETLTTPVRIAGGTATTSRLELRSSQDNVLYILARRADSMEVYLSDNAGKAWSYNSSVPLLFDRNSFAVSPKDPGLLAVGQIEARVSTDAGVSWTVVNQWAEYYGNPSGRLHADIPFITFLTSPEGREEAFISTDGGLYSSADSLRTVKNLATTGLGNSQYYSVYTSRVDTNYIFAGSQDQGFQRATLDDGSKLDFTQTVSGDYGHITSGDNGKSLWTNYPGFSMYYQNALQQSLSRGAALNFPTIGQLWLPPIVADPEEPTTAYLAGGGITEGTHLVRIELNTGTGTFTTTELPYDFSSQGSGPLTAFAISPADPNNWYVMTYDSRFFTSTNRGETWTETEEFSSPGPHYFYGACILPSATTPGLVYIAGSGYSNPSVWVSRDNGKTFEQMSDGLPPTLVFDLAASNDDRMVFAATVVGPYIYIADQKRWVDAAGTSAPDQTFWSVDYIDQNKVARFGTFGRGIWDLRLVEVPTGVEDADRATTKLQLAAQTIDLTTTAFTVELPRKEHISLHVYDLTGNMVAVLYDGPLEKGTHRFVWKGRATGGGEVPSGQYFCVAAASGTVAYAKSVVER